MATYRSITTTETDPQAPLTSSLLKALDANPTAIVEGAANAPKVMGQALDVILPYQNQVAAFPVINWTTGLDRATWLEFDVQVINTSGSSAPIRARISNDGGATWAGYTNLVAIVATGANLNYRIIVNLQTGEAYTPGNGSFSSASISLPGGSPNAIEFQMNATGASTTIRGIGKVLGGVTP